MSKQEMSELPSGYSIYMEDVKQRTQQRSLGKPYPDLPNKKYDILYADPPWHYNGKVQFDKSSKNRKELDRSKTIFISTAGFRYPTMKKEELMKIPITNICKDDCLLFMWATSPHLEQAIELGSAWGFEYRTVGFVWNKMNHNPGKYTLSNCELCLVFKKGRIPQPRGARNIRQLIEVPRTKHSEKPPEVADGIKKMFPHHKRIELFARKNVEDWDSWGLDVDADYSNR